METTPQAPVDQDSTAGVPETDFGALADVFDSDDGAESPEPSPEPAVTEPEVEEPETKPAAQPAQQVQQPVEAPVVTPAATAQPPVESKPQAVAQPPVTAPAADPQPPVAQPPLTQDQYKQRLTEARNNLISHFEQAYTIPAEEATLLATEPEKVLPKMAARMLVDTYEAVIGEVKRQLPGMMQQFTQAQQTNTEAANQFFKEWPDLNKPELHETVVRAAMAYRHMNPKATPEDMRRDVGRMVTAVVNGIASPSAPVAPVSAPAQPHVPVGTTAAGAPQPRPVEKNFYTSLYEVKEDFED